MFRLIGIIVVISVFVIGYSSLQQWYVGSATASETVVNIRDQIGAALKSSHKHNDESLGGDVVEKSTIINSESDETSTSSSFNTEDAARELIKHAND
jgi:hypothetical protein